MIVIRLEAWSILHKINVTGIMNGNGATEK